MTIIEDYKVLLEHSYAVAKTTFECPPQSRLEYLSEHIFDIVTYDSEMSELFASKAIDVCTAINNRKTFEFIEDIENYKWFLIICNIPFFSERIEWGASIRGAWWRLTTKKDQIDFKSCGLWVGDEQLIDTLKFSENEWGYFVRAIIEFAREELNENR